MGLRRIPALITVLIGAVVPVTSVTWASNPPTVSNHALDAPVAGMAAAPDGGGYWLVAGDGGVFAFGDAAFHGSAANLALDAPVAGMAVTPDGGGYWLVAGDGGVFAFGDAGFHGSMSNHALDAPVVGMAATHDGGGYWLVAGDGGVFAFGDAGFHGSLSNHALDAPVVGMAATHDGGGYWLVAGDGGVFAFGDAGFHGSLGGGPVDDPIVGMGSNADGGGYWLVAGDGGVLGFGDAPFYGAAPGHAPRIALYGDSLASEAAQDFSFIAVQAGSPVLLRTYGGTAVCDWLPTMAADAALWHPSVAVIEFTGNNTGSCMAGYVIGSASYYAKCRQDTQTAIDDLRAYGVGVVLVGVPPALPADDVPSTTALNQIYSSLASSEPGVRYVDAGQSVLAAGAFTWTLPCLYFEPCTGPAGSNIVRSPDGVHFCPSGSVTIEGSFAVCDVYSSGALRFAIAMLEAALGP